RGRARARARAPGLRRSAPAPRGDAPPARPGRTPARRARLDAEPRSARRAAAHGRAPAPGLRMSASPACLSCGSQERELVLDLGATPLANSNVAPERLGAPEPRFPLQLLFCKRCALVQLSEIVPPEELFSDYVYMTGASSTMVSHFGAFADEAVQRFRL